MSEVAMDEEWEDLQRKLPADREEIDQGLVVRHESPNLIEGNLQTFFRMTADQAEKVVAHFCEGDRN